MKLLEDKGIRLQKTYTVPDDIDPAFLVTLFEMETCIQHKDERIQSLLLQNNDQGILHIKVASFNVNMMDNSKLIFEKRLLAEVMQIIEVQIFSCYDVIGEPYNWTSKKEFHSRFTLSLPPIENDTRVEFEV